jgi:hypothetical protein
MQRHAAVFEHRAALPQQQRAVRIEHLLETTSIGIGVEGTIVNDADLRHHVLLGVPGRLRLGAGLSFCVEEPSGWRS